MAIRAIYRLDAKPFASWLSQRADAYGGLGNFAEKIEEDYAWIGKLMKGEFKTVDIDKVDEILCKDDTSHIREIYPELYEEYEY